MNYLSIAAIVRDEKPLHLDEWIKWHLSIGVEKIYIYDDGSNPPIQPRDNVVVIPVEGWFLQLPVYNMALKDVDSQWIAFIDADEFLVPHNYDLQKTLDAYKEFPGLGVGLLIFGTNFHKHYVDKPQIEKFTRRAVKSYQNCIKSIVQPKRTLGHNWNSHAFQYADGYCVNENYQEIPNFSSPHSSEIIQLNHYYYRSEEEFRSKCARYKIRNMIDANFVIDFDDYWAKEPQCNAEEDLWALQHWRKLPTSLKREVGSK